MMSSLGSPHDALLKLLKPGKRSVMSSYELARRIGVNQRAVGFMVSDLRLGGEPVGSVHGEGYYIIESPDELAETIEHIERRKRGIDRTVQALISGFSERKGVDDVD